MNSNSESHSSVHTYRVPVNLRSETRAKFDALLKAANSKNRKKHAKSGSKEQLLDDVQSTTASSGNFQEKETDNVEQFELSTFNEQSKNYILNKFLDGGSNSSSTKNNESTVSSKQNKSETKPKPPVPKPRKKKSETVVQVQENQSPTSQGTFEVTSPKIVKNNDTNTSVSSNKTYNVEEIGDVLIHKSPLTSKTLKTESSAPIFLEKGDTETLSDTSDSKADRISSKSLSKEVTVIKNIESDLSKEKVDVELPVAKSRKRNKKEKVLPESVEEEEELIKNSVYNYEKIVEITVHKTDRLQLNSLVIHPVVKIHVVDIGTGKYLAKSDKTRSVVFFYENKDYDYISPVMTHTCNLQEKRILFPSWEESILFNEDYEYFKAESQRIILFFEILDFVSFSELQQLNQKNCKKGWHHIAFAFLKLSSKNGILNAGKKMRLQLYYSHQPKKEDPHVCSTWTWWKNKKLEKYPSTLYVSFKPTKMPTKIVETYRSKTPVQGETSSKTKLFEGIKKEIPEIEQTVLNNNKEQNKKDEVTPAWSRTPREICKLPNKCLVKFDSSEDGCFVMKFSNRGVYLACAVRLENLYYIKIFSIQQLKEISKFPSHQGMIYDIKWSHDDALLLSASADNTVLIFNVVNYSFLQILPHPSFVYSCDISQEKVIITGCYDGVLRIWNPMETSKKDEFNLSQELEVHKGYITSLCFIKNFNILSADSTGIIVEWTKNEDNSWAFKREILLLDLKQTIINQIVLFPKGKKLLVHSRDSVLRIVDINSGCVLQWLRGAVNKRLQTFCGISPCGTYVYSGSENGHMHIWNSKNGQEAASCVPYSTENKTAVIHYVGCHPLDNIIAISHYGTNLPILLYCYDKNLEKEEIDITVKESKDNNLKKEVTKETELKNPKSKPLIGEGEGRRHNFKDVLYKMDQLINSLN